MMNRALYPPDWEAISRRIRFERAAGQCECTGQCGLHSGKRCEERHGAKAIYARRNVMLYPDWQRSDKSALADGARRRVECLWLNPAAAARANGRLEL